MTASRITASNVSAVASTTDAFGYETPVKTSWMNARRSSGLLASPPITVAAMISEKSITHHAP